MHDLKIGVIPGDGTGPEVVREGLKVLSAVAKKVGLEVKTVNYNFGGDNYLRTKELLPESAIKELRNTGCNFPRRNWAPEG